MFVSIRRRNGAELESPPGDPVIPTGWRAGEILAGQVRGRLMIDVNA